MGRKKRDIILSPDNTGPTDVQRVWEDRIGRATKRRQEWADQFREELSRLYFEGKQNPGIVERDFIVNNKIYSQLQANLPSLFPRNPYFYVTVKRSYTPEPTEIAEYDRRAKIRQAYLNYLREELDLKIKARLGIMDAHMSYGVLKVHYKSDDIENPNAGKPYLDELGEKVIDPETGKAFREPDTIPTNERYMLSRVHPTDFGWDEDAGTLEDKWSFVWERCKITYAQAKKDKRFDKDALRTIDSLIEKRQRDKTNQRMRDEDEILNVYEIYDLINERFLVFCEEADKPLIEERVLPPGIEKHPYCILAFTPRDNSPYPIPPISQAIDPQKEFNLARSDILKHRKRFNRKYEVVEAIDSEELAKLENGDDGTMIRVPQIGLIQPIQDAHLDQGRYAEVAALNNDIIEALGAPDQARGVASSDSATEAALLDKHLNIREADRKSIIADWLTEVASKLDKLVQTHISKDEAVRVTGPQGELFELVREQDYEEIDGEFQYSVNVGAKSPNLPQLDRLNWVSFMTLLTGSPMGPYLMKLPRFMKKMAEMHNIEDDLMIEELSKAGQEILQAQAQAAAEKAGGGGSVKGVPQQNPQTSRGGPMGMLMGGNNNGGGSPQLSSVS